MREEEMRRIKINKRIDALYALAEREDVAAGFKAGTVENPKNRAKRLILQAETESR
jgi:hypothetical protein